MKETKCMFCRKADKHDRGWEECSKCGSWAHTKCSGVDEESEEEWICPKCVDSEFLLKVPGNKTKKSGAISDSGTVPGASSVAVPTEEELAEEQRAEREAFVKQIELRKKRLAEKLAWSEQRMKEEAEMQALELKTQREIEQKQLAHDQEMLQRQLSVEKEFLKKRSALKKQIDASKAKVEALKAEKSTEQKVTDWLKGGENSGTGGKPKPKPKPEVTPESSDHEDSGEDSDSVKSAKGGVKKGGGSFGNTTRITREQMAARKVVSHALPKFKGEPEVWPLFISCFEHTTAACGFSNIENLTRLVEALDGEALENVRSSLVFPSAVPGIIQDLRNMFGRPEKLLKALLEKVRQAPAPHADRLGTFINFGMVVKQLCDHLEAAGLQDHLNNPMLVQELIEKLPPSYQMDWVRFKRGNKENPLRRFANFMKGIVDDASEVADFSPQNSSDNSKPERGKPHGRAFVHVHETELNQDEAPRIERPSRPCWFCKRADHFIRSCEDFKRMNVAERLREVERLKLCGRCLNNHGSRPCNFRGRCTVPNCVGDHHPLLHRAEETVQLQKAENSSRSVIFRMMPVTLHAGKRQYDTVAFLDEGSSATLVDDAVAKQLKAEGVPEPLIVNWTGNINRIEDGSRKVELMLSAKGSTEKFPLSTRTVGELLLPQQDVNYPEVVGKYTHLSGVPLEDLPSGVPTILIGLDNLHLFAPLESRIGQPCEPIAVRSKVGWTVYGTEKRKPRRSVHLNVHSVVPVSSSQAPEKRKVPDMQDGRKPSTVPVSEPKETQAREILEESTTTLGREPEKNPALKEKNEPTNRQRNEDCTTEDEQLEKPRAAASEHRLDPGAVPNTNGHETSKAPTKMVREIVNNCAAQLTWVRTTWSVNPPLSSHLGDAWERLMRSVSEALMALDHGRRLMDEIQKTAIDEAENARPLAYVLQQSDEAEAIYPISFQRDASPNQPGGALPSPHPAVALRDTWQRPKQLAGATWKRRSDENLPRRTRFGKTMSRERNAQTKEGNERKCWIRGPVDESIVGKDEWVSKACVRTESGWCKRAVAKLAVSEMRVGNPKPEANSRIGLRAGECSDNTATRSDTVAATPQIVSTRRVDNDCHERERERER
ncbi:uncharacterized protein LOC120417569 [Culex pipiens pallens]|uniref:uncharacterized protein LOC120417569 n=1 Tax=Culex pipiens pallens TaxID=42434 RepID=UPI0022AB0C7B|nr:uncharacterized protein LOC120417569 [Culex pipiens pallens]XP_039435605.2 uncharacterized protein LOC120417569 [Culex pipiens pallens]XP_039435606.2 uncharacterized protein LOC120417569 [Culex pipiens pallens]